MLRQSLNLKLQQKLSPQQIQLMKLLQVPTVELEQRIKDELEDNPALDEGKENTQDEYENEEYGDDLTDSRDDFDISDYTDDTEASYSTYSNNSPEENENGIPISGGETYQQNLIAQTSLRFRDKKQLTIAENIIGNLDESGYLRRELINMCDDLAFKFNIMAEESEIEEVLLEIQQLEPAGIAARNLQECLLLQLDRKLLTHFDDRDEIIDAIEVVEKQFDQFTKKHYKKIIEKLNISEEQLKAAIDEITKLNPKPAGAIKGNDAPIQHIIPDYILTDEDEGIHLTLNSRNAPELRINNTYADMFNTYANSKKTKEDKEAVLFIKQKLDSARWFIDAIKQRQHTMITTMQAIIEHQKEYFLTGDDTKLNPMILKDIAEKVDLDISTVSRVTNTKYIQTPFGTFLLKSFFSESLSTDSGEDVSTREVKKILEDIIDEEDKKKPLTDDKLAAILKEKGYNIARRTVAKYREQLDISVARLRKEL
jgi:RNA polymerase sigma-54 factor